MFGVCAGSYIEDDEGILVVREKDGRFNIPMGGIHDHESIEDCCVRETREEAKLHVAIERVRKIIQVTKSDGYKILKFVFDVRVLSSADEQEADEEVVEVTKKTRPEMIELARNNLLKSKDLLLLFDPDPLFCASDEE